MNAHAVSYPSLRRRLICQRRTRAFFSAGTTQHVRTAPLARELARAALAVAAAVAWSTLVFLLAA